MPYYINEECIGCTICAKRCPVFCIWGEAGPGNPALVKERHLVDPTICIDCGACASYCPVDCIHNEKGVIEKKIASQLRPVAVSWSGGKLCCPWVASILSGRH